MDLEHIIDIRQGNHNNNFKVRIRNMVKTVFKIINNKQIHNKY